MMNSAPTLEVKNLSFERNEKVLLNKINFSLKGRDALAIYGANGSGKSTLLKIIASFIPLQEEYIYWNNHSTLSLGSDYQKQIYFLGHEAGVKLNLTVEENLHYQAALQNFRCNKKIVMEILKKVGLRKQRNKLAATLSAGQVRRVGLARFLLQSKPLWLLDEPATALDQEGIVILSQLLKTHLEMNGIAIFATHQNLPLDFDVKILRLESNNA